MPAGSSRTPLSGRAQQQRFSCCTGGHGTDPKEQKTQQSPSLGRSSWPHPGHSKKNMHASVGISASVSAAHSGHRIVEISFILSIGFAAE